ncbi:cell division protein FtsX [Ferruginibacter sp.]|nr:permease-like cell division protein FtsX [Ferruginibacter sp.]
MAQFGKSSSKRGKPSYMNAIIGVSLVLFLFGIVGWFFLNLRNTGTLLKEKIQVHAWLSPTTSPKQIDSIKAYITGLPYTKTVEYVTKEMAAANWNNENDSSWKKILDNNPLPESIDFYVKAGYVQQDSLNALSASIMEKFPNTIKEFQFPTETVSKVGYFVKWAAIIVLTLAIILTILVIFLIDNTIRLAMYSNRFLVKTMQMVGATRGFISKPMNIRAVINGLIASAIAIVLLWVSVMILETTVPVFKLLHDTKTMLLLFLAMIVIGISITYFSTQRSILKYLKMKLDDLY